MSNPIETADPMVCDITFFIACFNEEHNIVSAIETVRGAAREVGCTYEMIIIDDASRDCSVQVIKEYMSQHPDIPIKLVENRLNQGLGANYAEASYHGCGKYYRLICGDDEERLESLVGALKHLGQADMVLTYHADNQTRPLSRRIVSGSYTGLVNFLGGHKLKYYNGLPVILRQHVMRWHSHAHGFGFQAELAVRLLDMGATYIEVPVKPKNRVAGETNAFTLRNLASVAHTLLQIGIRRMAKVLYPQYSRDIRHTPYVSSTPSFSRVDGQHTLRPLPQTADMSRNAEG